MAQNNRRVRKRIKAGSASYYNPDSLPAKIKAESQTEKKRELKKKKKHILCEVTGQEIYLLNS